MLTNDFLGLSKLARNVIRAFFFIVRGRYLVAGFLGDGEIRFSRFKAELGADLFQFALARLLQVLAGRRRRRGRRCRRCRHKTRLALRTRFQAAVNVAE